VAPEFLPIKQTTPGPLILEWTASEPGATYVLLAADRPDLADAMEIWRGSELTFTTIAPGAGAYYFAVHAQLGANISATANTAISLPTSDWVPDTHRYADVALLTVQRALIRMCAALGDQFALLSLPRHYRSSEATAHRARLAEGLADNERPALRYACLYHPWPISADTPGAPLAATPPDGAAAGVFARRARERGAWIAPAGQFLADVLALENPIADIDREKLAAAFVNTLAQQPRGFTMTDAMTLSEEFDWREINVRRLVSLLRRAAVRTAAAHVFEPNGDVLRRVIERRFGHMLNDLARRGAFAGKGGPDSYRLMVDVNDADRMNGRLAVEIAVAPSRPLRFLTVVLAQVGERLTVADER
jgi:phage tail sheath protein FI